MPSSKVSINIKQNQPDFSLNINESSNIFKKGLLEKILDPIKEDITLPRTVTVKCLAKNCKYVYFIY
jgi:hypothetical protein